MRFLAIILSLVSWIDLILDVMIELCFPPFGNTTRSWRIIQKSQKSIFEWSKVSKMRFLAIILSLVSWIDLMLYNKIALNEFQHSATLPDHGGSFKDLKYPFWMIQKAKNEVFGHFLEFGLLDRLDIAYCDSTKCLPTFGNVTRSSWIIQKSEKCIFEWSKVPKRGFSRLRSFGSTWYCLWW